MFRKCLPICLISFALVLVTVACSNTGENGKTASVAYDAVPAVLNFVGPAGTEGMSALFGEQLQKRFPNYTINFVEESSAEKVAEKVAGGQEADIVTSSIGKQLERVINVDFQYDIGNLIKAHNVDLSRFDPAPLDAMKTLSGGKLYGLPLFNDVEVMYYNQDLFDKFGVPYPKDGMTWDDAAELSIKMTRVDGGKTYLGLVVTKGHSFQTNQLSFPFVDPKTNLSTADNEGWKRIYQTIFAAPSASDTYKSWIRSNKNKLPSKTQFSKDFILAMLIDNFTFFPEETENLKKMNWDMAAMPVFKDMPGIGSQVYPKYLDITSTSKYKDQAMEVLKYLTSDEVQMEQSRRANLTVLKNKAIQQALGSATQFKDIHMDAVTYNKAAPASTKSVYDDVVLDEFLDVLPAVITGDKDVNTALRTVKEAADKAIAAKQ